MPNTGPWILRIAIACSIVSSVAGAAVKLPSMFGDHMVLQRDVPAPVWGLAAAGEKVTVQFRDQQVAAVADKDGKWAVKLGAVKAGGPDKLVIVAGSETVTLQDVLVGEVWVCSGQSNMELAMKFALDLKQESAAAAKNPNLRLFHLQRAASPAPLEQCQGAWTPCTQEVLHDFSAVAYYFGRDLSANLNVPVGVIESAWAGSDIESWLSPPTFAADPDAPVMSARWQRATADYPSLVAKFKRDADEYDRKKIEFDAALKEGKVDRKAAPRPPGPPARAPEGAGAEASAFVIDQAVYHYAVAQPSCLFNGMIRPLIPYAIKGVIWYQGEGNFDRPGQYRRLLPEMIRDWRKNWGEGDFPFLIVQLPTVGRKVQAPEPGPDSFAGVREAQRLALGEPNTGLAVAIDNTDVDLHPRDKRPVAQRLAWCAEGVAYGKTVAYLSPLYESMNVEGDAIRVKFRGAEGGLVAVGNEALRGFAIAGEDKKFVWANATIDGGTVIVRSPKVPHPVAARYAWDPFPGVNLANKAGLPASPFRTDNWPQPGDANR